MGGGYHIFLKLLNLLLQSKSVEPSSPPPQTKKNTKKQHFTLISPARMMFWHLIIYQQMGDLSVETQSENFKPKLS